MNPLFFFFLTLPAVLLTLPAIYLGGLLLFGLLRPPRRPADHGDLRHITVVVPAHNEATGIADTIQSLQGSAYPKNRYKILVLADNCTDRTAALAREAGAGVIERDNPGIRGKGQALDWLLKTRGEAMAGTDIIALVDADTRVDRKFLAATNTAFDQPGVTVTQGFYGVSNPGANWRTGLSTAALAVAHHLRPKGRQALGGTAGLKGNGMAFRADLLRDLGWPAHSVVEDLELTLKLLELGHRVTYLPEAQVFGEMAVTSRQASVQRQRWEGGRFQVVRHAARPLLRGKSRAPWTARMDAMLDLATPPLTQYAGLLGLATTALFLLGHPAWAGCAAALVAVGLVTLVALVQTKAPRSAWLSLLMTPAFLLWKLPMMGKGVLGRETRGWQRTPRVKETIKS
jgi:cellulose synthase/poly-beta-1,6-N-acetylglucosamine synthase-like glycosyltransferase